MRKYFVHYSAGGEVIKAVIEADSAHAAIVEIRKSAKNPTIFSVEDAASAAIRDLIKGVAK